jgi:hypothetical protein
MGQALVFGRPPAITRAYYDVRASDDEKESTESDCECDYLGKQVSSDDMVFKKDYIWKYKWTSTVLSSLHARAYAAIPPSYATVLDLTRMLETTPVWNPSREAYAYEPIRHILQRHIA